jgi:hypothetical protein
VWSVQVASSAQYIIEQFRATTGCARLEEGAVKSMYSSGKLRLAMLQDPAAGGGGKAHEGRFVLWQLAPGMWLVEMSVAGQHVAAGSDGRVAWRRTPWLGAHAARGGSRPLRRALQVGMAPPSPLWRRRWHCAIMMPSPISFPLFPRRFVYRVSTVGMPRMHSVTAASLQAAPMTRGPHQPSPPCFCVPPATFSAHALCLLPLRILRAKKK